jgi:hypothetical protein
MSQAGSILACFSTRYACVVLVAGSLKHRGVMRRWDKGKHCNTWCVEWAMQGGVHIPVTPTIDLYNMLRSSRLFCCYMHDTESHKRAGSPLCCIFSAPSLLKLSYSHVLPSSSLSGYLHFPLKAYHQVRLYSLRLWHFHKSLERTSKKSNCGAWALPTIH